MIGILDMRYVGVYNDTDGYEHIRPKLIGDTISDRPSAIIFQQRYKLEIGTTFHCISDGTDWEMKSDATWVQFIDSYLTNTYTKQEIDGFFANVEDEQSNQLDYIRQLVDEGAKNLLEMTSTLTEVTRNGVTASYDKTAGTVTLTGSHSGNDPAAIFELYSGSAVDQRVLPAGVYHLSGCPSGGSTSLYRGVLTQITGAVDTGSGATFTLTDPKYAAYRILISGNCDFTGGYVFKPMICRIEDWNISEKFVPYTPTLHELYELVRGYHP